MGTAKLGVLDRFLTVWIFIAMAAGIGLGFVFPNIAEWNKSVSVGTTNIPLAIGLILMMYPPLAKVNYGLLGRIVSDKKAISLPDYPPSAANLTSK